MVVGRLRESEGLAMGVLGAGYSMVIEKMSRVSAAARLVVLWRRPRRSSVPEILSSLRSIAFLPPATHVFSSSSGILVVLSNPDYRIGMDAQSTVGSELNIRNPIPFLAIPSYHRFQQAISQTG